MKFNINNKVVITSKDYNFIGGIHNFDTKETLIHNFGHTVNYRRYWGNKIIGIIREIGINDFYLIEDIEKSYITYVFCNTYNEMKLFKGN